MKNFKILIFLGIIAAVFVSSQPLEARRVKDAPTVKLHTDIPFIQVPAPSITPGFLPEQQELKGVVEALEQYLRDEGFGFCLDYFDPETTFISLSKDAASNYTEENPHLLDSVQPGTWTIIPQQLSGHGRDLQFQFATRTDTGELKLITLIIKGTGKGKGKPVLALIDFHLPSFYQRPFYIRTPDAIMEHDCREYVELAYASEPEENRFYTYAFVGGLSYEFAESEYLKSLAIHKLLLELDGKPAGIPIYTAINIITEIPVILDGRETTVKTEDYLTSPDILTQKELLAVAYELRERVKGTRQEEKTISDYLDLLWQDDYTAALAENPQLMQKVRAIVKRSMQIAALSKWEKSNTRVDDWYSYDDDTILITLRLLYGEDLQTEASIESVAKQFTYSLARTLGAIHGAGGSLTGSGSFVSSVDPKDISLSGEMQDLADSAYIPFFGADNPNPEIDLGKAHSTDRDCIIKSINTFLDKLTGALLSYRYYYELQFLCRSHFNEVYEQYYRLAQDYMQARGEK